MAEEKYVPRLKTKYNNEVKQQLQDKFQYENVMMIPKFEKIVPDAPTPGGGDSESPDEI